MKKLSYILIFFSLMVAVGFCSTPKVDHSNAPNQTTITGSINPYTIGT
jgi:hypothetical protein